MDALTRARDTPGTTLAPKKRIRGRIVMALLTLLVIAGTGAALWYRPVPPSDQNHPRGEPIPVLAAGARKSDVPIYLEGLGTVLASNTVTVRPQVDGKLISINFNEGQDVRAGEVLARIDPTVLQAALDQAVAKQAQDQSLLTNAKLDLARYQKLAATAYTSAQQADTQKALVAQLEAQIRQDQAQIDNARAQLAYTTITAPIDGRAGIRQIDAGNIVHAGDAGGIVVITKLRPISVLFTLPQQNLPQVAAALRRGDAEVQARAQGDSQVGVLDTGVLTVLDNQVDPATGTIKLKASFPNTQLTLWPGGFVRVRLRVDTARDAITVPQAAVQRGPRGAYVYVIGSDNSVTRRDVKLGAENEQVSIVLSGLRADERVVIDGASRLTDQSKVRIVEPPQDVMAPPRAASAPGTSGRRAAGQ